MSDFNAAVAQQIDSLSCSELIELCHAQWLRVYEAFSESQLASLESLLKQRLDQFVHVMIGSDYVVDIFSRYPDLMLDLLTSNELDSSLSGDWFDQRFENALKDIDQDDQLQSYLRRERHRAMVRIIWRDLNQLAPLEETTRDLSRLADAAIEQTMNWHHQRLLPLWGQPCAKMANGDFEPQRMLVLGMGKLGADELNLSSDIDLIFVYPESGWTRDGKKEISNQEFFIKLGQKIIQTIDNVTPDGFVFRVDMRLRPYGDSGPLVMSFNAIEEYYQSQGREWERYAMIKARVMAGNKEVGSELMTLLRPFVYRKYIDFSVIDALRGLKEMINREVLRKGLEHNIKLGRGGIREVEFIAQVFQLIRGGMDVRLQERSLLKVLQLLQEGELLSEQAYSNLVEAYRFLRDVEHAIQAQEDKQTQLLPDQPLAQIRLAHVMGFADWQDFQKELARLRTLVAAEFMDVIAAPEDESDSDELEETPWHAVWLDELEDSEAEQVFIESGFDNTAQAWKLIKDLKHSRKVKSLQSEGLERLNAFMPLLLAELAEQNHSTQTLSRILVVVDSVIRRTAYLVLLMENPGALKQLIRLCAASPLIAHQLAKTPVIMDELINTASLYSPPNKAALQDELRQHMLRIPEEDLEALMDSLRHFKNAHVLRVAAAEVTGALPLMKASDYLTYIAETILEAVVDMSWHQMVEKYGYPGSDQGTIEHPQLIIVGYGKMGGLEMGYRSDLDIVFLHDAQTTKYTDGKKQVDNQTFYTRMVQRVVHILSTVTPAGDLYEIDMRLRPEGNSGMLVSTLKTFEDYQYKNAWTWEHQSLVRARVVAGCSDLAAKFERVRAQVLKGKFATYDDPDKLRNEVVDMRGKMIKSLATEGTGQLSDQFHLKHDEGGIVDIEFLVQYAVLRWASKDNALLKWPDNIRILETLEQLGLMTSEQANQLIEAYKMYRIAVHKNVLDDQGVTLEGEDAESFSDYRQIVRKIWQHFMTE